MAPSDPPAPAPALNLYLSAHYEQPNVQASVYYATTATTRALSPQELAMQLAGFTPDRPEAFWHNGLHYPEVSDDPDTALEQIRNAYANCARCHLSERRTKVVFFRGNPDSPVLLFGEAPGKKEDVYGFPFVGKSGKLQDKILELAGLDPEDLGWANMVGCRPCANRFSEDRPPSIVEKAACSERTLMLLRAIRPAVVVCLGQVATTAFFEETPHPWTWTTHSSGVVIGHARHPAYLLRRLGVQGGEAERVAAINFFRALKERLPYLRKVDRWTLPMQFLGEFATGRIATHK